MSFTTAALLLTWIALLALTLACAGLLRMVQDLQRRVGSPTSSAEVPVTGLALPAQGPACELRPEGGGLVVFVSPSCSACADVLDEIGELQTKGAAASLVIASLGPCPAQGREVSGGLERRCIPDAHGLADLLQVPATPFLLAVDSDGTIADTHLPHGPGSTSEWLSQQKATSR